MGSKRLRRAEIRDLGIAVVAKIDGLETFRLRIIFMSAIFEHDGCLGREPTALMSGA